MSYTTPLQSLRRGNVFACLLFIANPIITNAAEPLAKIEGELPNDLSDLTYSIIGQVDAPPRSMAQARRRVEQASKKANTVMQSLGYYGANITSRIDANHEPAKNRSGEIKPILTIETGTQFQFGSLDISYVSQEPEIAAEAFDVIRLESGGAALAAEVVAAEARIVSFFRAKGYPFAKALTRKAVADHATETLNVTFKIESGDKTRFGKINQTGTAYLVESWPKIIAPFKEGDIYDDRKLNQLAARVIGTGVFDGASASLSQNFNQNADGTITRDVTLNVEQGAINTVQGDVGYSTSEGSGVDLTYERRNFIGYAQTLTIGSTVKTNEISLGVGYNIPFAWRDDREFDIGASVARENTEAFTGERVTLHTLMTQKFSPKFKASLGAGLEASQFDEADANVRSYLFDGLLSAEYDSRSSLLNPQKGYHVEANLTPSYNFGDEDGVFANAELGVSNYRKISNTLTAAGRVKIGTIFGADQESVPLNRRYYGGGGGSVRGFEYQSISPADDDGESIGGRSLVEASAELRYRGKGNLGYVGFLDAGSVAESDYPDFKDIKYGLGAGVRYYTSFAPLRADIAFPLNKDDGDADFQLYISIGQAF